MKTTSAAKTQLIEFIQSTRENPLYEFYVTGNENDAKTFIHRMRVELSRMRDAVKSSGRTVKEFKVKVVSISVQSEKNRSLVQLEKVEGRTTAIADELKEIFDDLDGGAILQ